MRKSLYSLVLLTLISFKVCSATIHINLQHDHEDGHENPCELCEHALSILNTEFSSTVDIQGFEAYDKPEHHQQIEGYESVCVVPFLKSILFVRPPPSII